MLKGLLTAAAIIAILVVTGVARVELHPENLAAIPGMAMDLAAKAGVSKTLMAKVPIATPSSSATPAVKGAHDEQPAATQIPSPSAEPAKAIIPLQF